MKVPQVTVEVVFARPGRQSVHRVPLPAGSTVQDALEASGLAGELGKLDTGTVGIYGKVVPAGTILRDGDRVEIYRPLLADPKDLRRARAARKRAKT
ncbi:MAG TPA: RnfH family protein [Burkholderiales bacterium]|nr:RnfH family protein [Burkholderiales bacterium]